MILDFPYVDHVIHEVLRMYPPVPRWHETSARIMLIIKLAI